MVVRSISSTLPTRRGAESTDTRLGRTAHDVGWLDSRFGHVPGFLNWLPDCRTHGIM